MSVTRAARGWLRVIVLAGTVFALCGCRRKAPGPDECRAFALHAFGVTNEDQIRRESTLDHVDDLTTECLVTPYDTELLACVEEGGAAERCLRAFGARHRDSAAARQRTRQPREHQRELPVW